MGNGSGFYGSCEAFCTDHIVPAGTDAFKIIRVADGGLKKQGPPKPIFHVSAVVSSRAAGHSEKSVCQQECAYCV